MMTSSNGNIFCVTIFQYALLVQLFVQAQIKENIKAPRHRPLYEGNPSVSGELPHKGPVTRKMFPVDDVIRLKTLNVRGPSYLGLTRSISWLLMPWLLTSPGHQQLWHWLYKMCRSFSYLKKYFKYLCRINVEEWHKMQIYVYVPSEEFSM